MKLLRLSFVVLVLVAVAPVDQTYAGCLAPYDNPIAGAGSGPGEFNHPQGIVYLPPYLFIADTGNNRIQKWGWGNSSQLEFELSWGSLGTGTGDFNSPADIAVGPAFDRLYVVDSGNDRIQVFGLDGTFIMSWGATGSLDGEFITPRSIVVDNSSIYVTDSGNHRVQKFNLNGVFVDSWGSEGVEDGQFLNPSGIAVSEQEVFVADEERNIVQVFDASGQFNRTLGAPGTGKGQMMAPTALSFSEYSSSLLVADSGNNRGSLYSRDGTWICDEEVYILSEVTQTECCYFLYGISTATSQLIEMAFPDPVEATTWSGIKTRFRNVPAKPE
jgi:DNA-binding beta-propeller fold protein YncE